MDELKLELNRNPDFIERLTNQNKWALNTVKCEGEELPMALYHLAQTYRYGWGLNTDHKLALEYYKRASKLGHVKAGYKLARLYLEKNELGVKKSYSKALKIVTSTLDVATTKKDMANRYYNNNEHIEDLALLIKIIPILKKDSLKKESLY